MRFLLGGEVGGLAGELAGGEVVAAEFAGDELLLAADHDALAGRGRCLRAVQDEADPVRRIRDDRVHVEGAGVTTEAAAGAELDPAGLGGADVPGLDGPHRLGSVGVAVGQGHGGLAVDGPVEVGERPGLGLLGRQSHRGVPLVVRCGSHHRPRGIAVQCITRYCGDCWGDASTAMTGMALECVLEETGVHNAPTRRPKSYPDRRRSPKGRRSVAGSIRDRLTTAAAHLKNLGDAEAAEAERLHQDEEAASAHRDRADEAYDAAAAVESIMAPRGYLLLRRQEQTAPASPLTVTLNEDLNRTLLAAGEEFGVVFSGLAEEAYRLVRDSEWLPPKPTKAARGTGGKKAVLNVRVDAVLRQEVQELLPALAERVGYRITEGSIVLAHICEELGIERPGAEEAEWLR